MQQQQRLVLHVLLLAWAGTVVLAGSPLNVYTSCVMPDGVVGQCRNEPRVQAAPSDVQAGAVLELPIDMRLPCEDTNRTCAENVDVAEVPIKPPSGPHIGSCSVTLMPWSPFPCSFNTDTFKGVEGQNKTNWCFTERTKPDEPGFEYARDLVTDGYNNLYHGWLPDRPCGGSSSSSNADGDSGSSSSSAGDSSSKVVLKPRYGKRFSKVLLTVNFRVAAGRQFDRTYWFQIGHAVVALGTCTEPTRWLGTDKWWSTTIDITHLQAYLEPGSPTRMSLANLISNTYNVPIWAEAKIQYFWERHKPSRPGVPVAPAAPTAAGAADVSSHTSEVAHEPIEDAVKPAAAAAAAVQTAWGSYAGPEQALTHTQQSQQQQDQQQPGSTDSSSSSKSLQGEGQGGVLITGPAAAAAASDVPDEVVPLVPRQEDAEAVSVLNGDGGRSWPSATFKLPHSLSEPGNIYRAQLLITPKADACEEFWAMNPSGAETNNTCGGLTTGEPYREVRVYVNGQLAGFTPIYYTMYTGGVDPRLWSAIVASYTYSLPTYTFDLSPWLPQLNSHPRPSSSSSSSSMPATATGHSTPSSSSSSDSRLPSVLHKPTPSRRLTQDSLQADSTGAHAQQQQQQQQQPPGSDTPKQAAHTITVELGGATGNGWIVASTLLLWRADDSDGQPVVVSGDQQVHVKVSKGFDQQPESECQPLHGDVAVAGKCTLKIRDRSVEASSELRWQDHKWQAHVRYATARYDNVITYNNDVNVTDGSLSWYQETRHHAEWSLARQRPSVAAAAAASDGSAAEGRVLEQQQQQHTDVPLEAGTDQNPQQQRQQQEQRQQLRRQEEGSSGSVGGSHVITQSSVKYDWLNAGVVAAGGAFEYSFNTTLLEPTVYSTYAAGNDLLGGLTGAGVADSSEGSVRGVGSEGDGAGKQGEVAHVVTGEQRHYQRAIMLNVYNPQSPRCVVPDNATHTVRLRNSIGSGSSSSSTKGSGVDEAGRAGGRDLAAAASDSSCVRRRGTCGFCAAWLMCNEIEWGAQNC